MLLAAIPLAFAAAGAAGLGGNAVYNAVQKSNEEKKLATAEPIVPTVTVGNVSLVDSVQKGYIRLNGKEVPISSLDEQTITSIQDKNFEEKRRMFQSYIDERDKAWKLATYKENKRRSDAKLPKETSEEMDIRKKQFLIDWEIAQQELAARVTRVAALEAKRREEADKKLDRKMAMSQEQEQIKIEHAKLALEAEIRKIKEQEEETNRRREAERKAEEERIAEEDRLAEQRRLEKQKALEEEEAELLKWEQDLQKLSEEEELQKWETDVAAKQLAEQKLKQEQEAQQKAKRELEEKQRQIEEERLRVVREEQERLRQLALERQRQDEETQREMERMQLEVKALEEASKLYEENMKKALQETESLQVSKGVAMTFPAIKNPKEYKQYLDDLRKYDDLVACYNSSWTQQTFADKARDLVKRLRELTESNVDEFFDRRRAWYRIARTTPQDRRSGDWKICWQNISRIYEIIFYEVQEKIKSNALEQLIKDVVSQRDKKVEAYYQKHVSIPSRRLAELMEHFTKPQYENDELILRPKKIFDTPESIALRKIYQQKFKGRRLESIRTKMR